MHAAILPAPSTLSIFAAVLAIIATLGLAPLPTGDANPAPVVAKHAFCPPAC